jgi:hypothetical protein
LATPEEIKQENRRVRTLRILTDLTFQRLCLERMSIVEAREAVHDLRMAATNMFPGKGGVFDLVIAPRLERVIMERFGQTALITN